MTTFETKNTNGLERPNGKIQEEKYRQGKGLLLFLE